MDYDLIVIGAGWAGFNAALEARANGLKVALIEKENIGGTCLNQGCIPTKALIQSSKIYSIVKDSSIFGIESRVSEADFSLIQKRKNQIILGLQKGMNFMLKNIDFISGKAEFVDSNSIKINDKDISAKSFIIASGSRPQELPGLNFDNKKIFSSTQLLNIEKAPASLLIVGGGVIGCEFANLFNKLGSKVAIVEKMPRLLPGEDSECSKKIEVLFKKKGVSVNINADALSFDKDSFEAILVCVGRKPYFSELQIEKAGVKLEKGAILVDEFLRTNIANIFAAGDCTGKTMLAHFAAYQGRIAANNASLKQDLKKADNHVIPNCIFTEPEIASVGINEEYAKEKNLNYQVKKFDFLGCGMARIINETEGFIKIIFDKDSGVILGASIVGPKATELVAVLSLAVSVKLKVSQVRETIFAHPTLSEAIAETLS